MPAPGPALPARRARGPPRPRASALAEPEPVGEPGRLTRALPLVPGRAGVQLGRARRGEGPEAVAVARAEAIDVADKTAERRNRPDAELRLRPARRCEGAQQLDVPLGDPPEEAATPRDQLPLLLGPVVVQLDRPQLGPEPVRKVARPTGVDPGTARLHALDLDPLALGPDEPRERRDPTTVEDLVRRHAVLHPRKAASSRSCRSPGSSTSRSRPVAAIVARICSKYVLQPSQNARCSSN